VIISLTIVFFLIFWREKPKFANRHEIDNENIIEDHIDEQNDTASFDHDEVEVDQHEQVLRPPPEN